MKQSFSDAPIKVCPECDGHTHKVIGPVGVVFKGSGFYVTDSRSDRASLTGSGKKRGDETGTSADTSDKNTQAQTQSQTTDDKGTSQSTTTTSSPKIQRIRSK